MQKFNLTLLILLLLFIPLYPKFPLLTIGGSYVSIRLDDLVVALVFAVFLIRAAKNKFRDFTHPISKAILLYLFIGLVTSFSGIFVVKSASVGQGLLHTFRRFEYFSLFYCGLTFLKTKTDLKFIMSTIILTGFLVSLYGLGQAFFAFPVISTTNSEFSKGIALTLGPGARINSTFAGHYDLAAYSIFPLLLIIAILPFAKPKWPLLIIGLAIYWTLLLSASRITFASFVVTSGLLVILIRKKYWLVPLGIILIAGVLISPQLKGRYLELITNHLKISSLSVVHAQDFLESDKNVSITPDALKEPAQPEDRSFNIRLQAEWPRAIRAFQKNPLLGTGFSSVGLAVDNDLLRSLAETGLFGTAAFLLIFIRFFKTSLPFIFRYPHSNPSLNSALIISFSLGLIGLGINALFIDVFTASKIALTTWCLMGIAERAKATLG